MGKGSNSSALRRYNERVLLAALRNLGSASKSDLAHIVNLTPQAVTRIVDDLDSAGLVSRRGRRLGGKGQPSVLYSVDPEGAYSIGVKLGRDDLEILLMDFSGEVLKRLHFRYDVPEPEFVVDSIEASIRELTLTLPEKKRSRILGVGIAMPWFMGEWTAETQMSEELAQRWDEFNFETEMASRTHLRVIFENDCAAAAIAELLFGRGTDIAEFLYVYIGTFIGGGLVKQGKLEPGFHGNAAAIASMPVPASKLHSVPAAPAQYQTLLNRASLFVLRRHVNVSGIELPRTESLSKIMDVARREVQEWMDDCADALVFALLSAASLMDLEAIVIDGELPRYLVDELVEMVARRMENSGLSGVFVPRILSGHIGADAVSRGGAILPFYADFAPDKSVLLTGGVPARVPA